MKVLKFGGTSVGSPQRMKEVCKIFLTDHRNLVVLSAMSGTTNSLVEIAEYFKKGNPEAASLVINQMRLKYDQHVQDLYSTTEWRERTYLFLNDIFSFLFSFANSDFDEKAEKTIVAQGEIISTNMVTNYLLEKGIKATLLSALDFMRLSENGEPDLPYIKEKLGPIIEANKESDVFITQGFIARNSQGEIDNLQRGGSDYTACLIGAALKAEEIQIWTDIDGMHNNDPRYVKNTKPVRQLNFEEAAELAYFGAKILHPTCIQPARYADVPVRLLNTMEPSAPGTIINNEMRPNAIKAVAAKDNITAIKIISSRMFLAHGFLSRVSKVFEKYQTSVDMITTSEVGISLSIDNRTHLDSIVKKLKQYGTVEIDDDMCIICVVGDLRWGNVDFETKILQALSKVPIRMISYGGCNHNISFLIRAQDKKLALNALSESLF
ncbi:MAG: aspartate kinase [Alloprevotella sp.]|nr:aspartate kinase [Alloprevotella sp.]